jgi:hypothetical protein
LLHKLQITTEFVANPKDIVAFHHRNFNLFSKFDGIVLFIDTGLRKPNCFKKAHFSLLDGALPNIIFEFTSHIVFSTFFGEILV